MVVTLGTFTISTGGKDLPKDLEIDVQTGVEIGKFLRAKGIKTFARGNKLTTISFTVQKEFSNYSDAEQFCLTHDRAVPDTGDLVMTNSFSDGSFSLTLQGASKTRCTTKHKGVLSYATYQFIGGIIVSVIPSK